MSVEGKLTLRALISVGRISSERALHCVKAG